LAEIGSIERFPSAKKFCSYTGLVSSVHCSGSTLHYGRITKQGCGWLRWILVQVARVVVLLEGRLRDYLYLARRKGSKVVIVACARAAKHLFHRIMKQTPCGAKLFNTKDTISFYEILYSKNLLSFPC
jgi:transposase